MKPSPAPLRPIIYNVGSLDDDEIKLLFVARQREFDLILKDLSNEDSSHEPRHHLIQGQRGMGKTTLMCRLAAELRSETHKDAYVPLNFPEEQYVEVDSLGAFWLNCLDSLADAYQLEGATEEVVKIDRKVQRLSRITPPQERDRQAEEAVAEAFGAMERRPVLFIDNFSLLIAKLKDHDFGLRAFFNRPGAPIIVAASLAGPDRSTEDYGAAFYEGFRVHLLKPLTSEDMAEIITQLAEQDNRSDIPSMLRQEQGRLKVLRDLSGGNPRAAVLLYGLFCRGLGEDAHRDLEALLDQMTPLYQSRLEQLSEQGSQLVAAMARHWAPIGAADLAAMETVPEAHFQPVPRGSVSSVLGRLEEMGMVERTVLEPEPGKGHLKEKAGYQIAERLFNIWYLMRFSSRRQRSHVSHLARFLQAFYTQQQLRDHASQLLSRESIDSEVVAHALAVASAMEDGSLASELQSHVGLTLAIQCAGIRERIAEVIDPDALPSATLEIAECRQRILDLVPKDSPLVPQVVADTLMGCPFLVPPYIPGREFLANLTALPGDLDDFVKDRMHSEPGLYWLQQQILRGLITRWDNREEVLRIIARAPDAVTLVWVAFLVKPWNSELEREALIRLFKDQIDPANEEAFIDAIMRAGTLELVSGNEPRRRYSGDVVCYYGMGCLVARVHSGSESSRNVAIKLLQSAVKIDATFLEAWIKLGDLLSEDVNQLDRAADAYQRAIAIEPSNEVVRSRYTFLLRDQLGEVDEARAVFAEVKEKERFHDTLALHDALFALHDDNWGLAQNSLIDALESIEDALPEDTRDDWYRAVATIIHLGFGEKFEALFRDRSFDKSMLPLFTAIRAHALHNEKHLRAAPAEAREVAEEIYRSIETYRNRLSQSRNAS